jgi:hypothetical protein
MVGMVVLAAVVWFASSVVSTSVHRSSVCVIAIARRCAAAREHDRAALGDRGLVHRTPATPRSNALFVVLSILAYGGLQ